MSLSYNRNILSDSFSQSSKIYVIFSDRPLNKRLSEQLKENQESKEGLQSCLIKISFNLIKFSQK